MQAGVVAGLVGKTAEQVEGVLDGAEHGCIGANLADQSGGAGRGLGGDGGIAFEDADPGVAGAGQVVGRAQAPDAAADDGDFCVARSHGI